jgi:hypothetical protein
MNNIFTKIFASAVIAFFLIPGQFNYSQVQRNPVIEACTGTWCQWCPCGHDIIDDILIAMPNAIAIEYHGPVNSSDPWRNFQGNNIINLLGFTGYPTGVIDRTGPPLSRSVWFSTMSQRNSLPATVDITMDKSYNKITRELDVTIHATAQTNLTGEYRLSFLILESGLVYPQTGNGSCPGASDYIHNHVVRAMINDATGDELNGANPWNTGETISKPIQYTVPVDLVTENCELVAFVYTVQSPLYNGEIQQGQKWPLTSPDYVVSVVSTSADVIAEKNIPAQFTTTIINEGLLDDTYSVEVSLDGPEGWTGTFTTVNGTFNLGQTDLIDVETGSTSEITINISPNGISGFGVTTVQFTSQNDPGVIAIATLRNVTTTGVPLLVIDGSEEGHGSIIYNSLENFFTERYAIVSRNALQSPGADISNFAVIAWTAGVALPVFNEDDVNALQDLLDNGGRLFITGQDIGADIFEAGGQSQFAQDFYTDYLHAEYLNNFVGSFLIFGIDGDPISDSLIFALNSVYTRSPDEVSPADANATPVLKINTNPAKYAGLKADAENYRVVYLAVGMEQIDDQAVRDTLISRTIAWLMEGVTVDVGDKEPLVISSFVLNQNYPNPFNPATTISYSIAADVHVSLKIYDVMGAEVAEIVNKQQPAGNYEVSFDASKLSSGMYFYRLNAGEFTSVKKMTLLK